VNPLPETYYSCKKQNGYDFFLRSLPPRTFPMGYNKGGHDVMCVKLEVN